MRRVLSLILLVAGCVCALTAKQPFDVQGLMRIARISDVQLSPDGRMLAFTVAKPDLEANQVRRNIYVVNADGGAPRQLTAEGSQNFRPRWSPDSRRIAFVSNRSGSSQIWVMNADGSGQRQVTRLSTEAEGHLWTPDGNHLLFVSRVFPECVREECNRKKLEEEKSAKVRARIYDSLLYRHWNEWRDNRRRQLMLVSLEDGWVKQLTRGDRDVPPFSLGGGDGYDISPDGREVLFVQNTDENLALSTNWDIFAILINYDPPVAGEPVLPEPVRITNNPAADADPQYSPDGRLVAFRMQTKPGYESDKWRLAILDRSSGQLTVLTESIDRPVQSFVFTPDSTRIAFTIEDRGSQNAMLIPVTGGGARSLIAGAATTDDLQFTRDGRILYFTQHSGSSPLEIYRVSQSGGSPQPLTRLNDSVLDEYQLGAFEELWVEGAGKDKVHAFLLKPSDFDPKKKYPVLFLIHGGPQGAWKEAWSYRWNPQVFAGAGFLVVMPNPRGSTGFGQRFTDEINQDWGGKVYDDIMAVVENIGRLPFADAERMAAAGGSFGGYMVNWMLGHTNRFKALVSHAGVYDLRSMSGETEELWFPIWEFGGMYWENPEVYERWSPSNFVKQFATPTLVIHGELDYRVPVGQGLQLFTALQLRKVPSKLLLFPDEGHWVLKPQNSILWHKTFLDWVTEWTSKEKSAEPNPAAAQASRLSPGSNGEAE